MPTLPAAMIAALAPFAPLGSRRVWQPALVLVVGALLAPGQRTVAAALRAVGLAQGRRFERDHRVLNRAQWSSLAGSRILLGLLVAVFAPTGPLLIGVDETLERRRGRKIAAKGSYRDPVRSSHEHFVKVSGLRWVGLMRLVPIPWAHRVWALPFLTALAPSERSDRERGRRHKPLTDWARQLLRVVRRWWPERPLVAVADSRYAALEFLAACRAWPHPVTVVTRLRLDAALYEPAPPRPPRQTGRPRLKGPRRPTRAAVAGAPTTRRTPVTVAPWDGTGERLVEVVSATAGWYHAGLPPVPLRWVLIRDPQGKFATQALLCTDADVSPAQSRVWFVQRWQLAVTFEEARRHLGLETQRQWSALAIRRTTPAWRGLCSLGTVCAHQHMQRTPANGRQAAWDRKARPTCAAALAWLRRELWAPEGFCPSAAAPDRVQVPRTLVEHLIDLLCHAA